MRYALLVCDDETAALSEAGRQERFAAFLRFQHELTVRGMLVSRERLQPTSSSTTVRIRDSGLVIADGPFAETKEQIAGFFVVECEDLDQAIEMAAKIPAAEYGTIEVRPVWEM
jgi:hypothetical protein